MAAGKIHILMLIPLKGMKLPQSEVKLQFYQKKAGFQNVSEEDVA
jgi:hypothetical protein